MSVDQILVVEREAFFAKTLERAFRALDNVILRQAATPAAALKFLPPDGAASEAQVSYAVLDIDTADANGGRLLDRLKEADVPIILFSSNGDEEARKQALARGVMECVVKGAPDSVENVVALVDRLRRNRDTKILVVDDEEIMRRYIRLLLEHRKLQVVEAANGVEAIKALEADADIRLVIADNQMPEMGGLELTQTIRKQWPRMSVAVMGLSAAGGDTSVKFLQNGASDYIKKPFLPEELYCRVRQNLEVLEAMAALDELASKDALTGLYNRRHFFSVADTLTAKAGREGEQVTIAMLDIDHFKTINDTHGHAAGDAVLKTMAGKLTERLRKSDLVARIGGEEFVVLTTDLSKFNAESLFDGLRAAIAEAPIAWNGVEIPITVSIGVASGEPQDFVDVMAIADHRLYQAKKTGRNKVVLTDNDDPLVAEAESLAL